MALGKAGGEGYGENGRRLPVPGEKAPTLAEIKGIIQECKKKKLRKHEMLIKVGWNLAVRLNELANLRIEDFDFVEDVARIRKQYAKKANKDLLIVMNEPGFTFDLQDYIREMRLEKEDYLFCHGDQRSKYSNRRIAYMIEHAGELGGFKRLRPHLLRHSRAKWLIKNGYDPRYVQKLLRHKNASTTINEYTRYNLEDLKDIGRRGQKANLDK